MLPVQYLRSWLFVPGDDRRKIDHAAASYADAVILDWEDAVLPERKPQARECCRELEPLRHTGKRVLVRINSYPSPWHASDLESVGAIRPDGLVLPKCESVAEILEITAALQKQAGDWKYALCPIIESPLGLLRAEAIATVSDRVCALAFGAQDFCAAADIRPSPDETELLMAKSVIVTIAKAHRLAAIDSPVVVLHDLQTVREAAHRSCRMGFTGKLAIHPKHVPAIAEAFAPTANEAREAAELLQEAAMRKMGAFSWKEQMVDEATLEKARHTVERFQAYVKQQS